MAVDRGGIHKPLSGTMLVNSGNVEFYYSYELIAGQEDVVLESYNNDSAHILIKKKESLIIPYAVNDIRYIEISMLPLSFKEYVTAAGEGTIAQKYREYLETGSFPYALNLLGQPKELRDYLEGLYNTIVVKDIASRKKISDTMMLESVVRFVFDNIGSPLSAKKIADTLTSEGRKIDVKTVEKYLNSLLESFIAYRANRYNIMGKQHLKTLEKYYVVDIGMRHMLLGSSSTNIGYILENVVYLELVRRGYEVYVGKIGELEVDFVAVDKTKTTYFQVAATVRDENALRRELASLEKIKDHYPKFILTLDDDPEADYNGIRRVNALEWLIGKVD